MKVFVAGATGAIGKPLVRQLVARGHDVTGLTRRQDEAQALMRAGAKAVIGDVFDQARLRQAMQAAQPDVIVSELTALPQSLDPRKLADYYEANNRVRAEGTRGLLEAAAASGAHRFVSQSAAFWYAPAGELVKGESAPFWTDAPEPIGQAVRTMVEVEQMVRDAPNMSSVNLRYGTLYGPGTWFSSNGDIARRMRARAFPIIGDGEAMTSFIHVEDAAAATVAAVESTAPGDFNVADDEPAPAKAWMPALAEALGARKPLRVPEWLARLLVGRALVAFTVNQRGAANQKAKRELAWRPRYGSWRTGFAEALG